MCLFALHAVLVSMYLFYRLTQLYLLRDCDILKLVMDSLENFLSDLQGDPDANRIASRHSSAMGNLILMAQVKMHASHQ